MAGVKGRSGGARVGAGRKNWIHKQTGTDPARGYTGIDRYRILRYGLNPDEYAALLLKQGGGCAICHRRVSLCVDHCHSTGKVRGLLCGNCNGGIGMLGDDPAALRSAIAYLERG